jgi:hypothetical protein
MFGMTAGYAYAQHQHNVSDGSTGDVQQVSLAAQSSGAAQSPSANTNTSAPAPQNNVINVPIPQAAPATPVAPSAGNNYSMPSPTQQQSSGSH